MRDIGGLDFLRLDFLGLDFLGLDFLGLDFLGTGEMAPRGDGDLWPGSLT